MKTLMIIIVLFLTIAGFGQVPLQTMKITATNKSLILIIHRNDTCIHNPIYIQKGAACISNFPSFENMNYAITDIWGLALAYVQSNGLKSCGDPEFWTYEQLDLPKVITIKNSVFLTLTENHENIYNYLVDKY